MLESGLVNSYGQISQSKFMVRVGVMVKNNVRVRVAVRP